MRQKSSGGKKKKSGSSGKSNYFERSKESNNESNHERNQGNNKDKTKGNSREMNKRSAHSAIGGPKQNKYGKPGNSASGRNSHGKNDKVKGGGRIAENLDCKGLSEACKGIVRWKNGILEIPGLIPGEKADIQLHRSRQGEYATLARVTKPSKDRVTPKCPYFDACGGCQLQHMSTEAQKRVKEDTVGKLLGHHCKVEPIITMDHPYDYRNKIHATFGYDSKRQIISGMYAESSHKLIDIDRCIIQDPRADVIIATVKKLAKSFKMDPYDEDSRYGFLRHVLVRVGKKSGQIMVVIVGGSPVFKGKKNFVKALREAHPEITTIVFNINDKKSSMVLGERETVLYGSGKIMDTLCGLDFEISPKSFYQINHEQTEKLYALAIDMAGLTGKETVLDAYCGTGTIGLIASKKAGKVIGVELNADAVRDAVKNAKRNHADNVEFHKGDASDFMVRMANKKQKADVVIMDPPRSGSTEVFIESVAKLAPEKVVYVSCNPVTLARDLDLFSKKGYKVQRIVPVDMFAQTYHVEAVVSMVRNGSSEKK